MFGGGEIIWIVILVIVLLLLGPGRLSKIFGEIGSSIRSFREGLGSKDEKKDEQKDENTPTTPKPEG